MDNSNFTRNKKGRKIKRFTASIESGLTFSMIEERKQARQTNAKILNPTKSYFRILAENIFTFCNTVTIILVAILFTIKEYSDTFSSMIIALNIFIGVLQSFKAKWAVKKLCLVVDSTCKIMRDGNWQTLDVKEIVVDDIIMLSAGMQVPVDCILRSGEAEMDESILSGESAPVKKSEGDYLLSGSNVLVGEIIVQADRVGRNSYIQRVARAAGKIAKPRSKIFSALDRIIKTISFILVPLAVLSFVFNYYVISDVSVNSALKYTCASALAMLPVGMFFLTSCALAAAVLKLSQKNTLVQDLYSIEMLAMVDTLLLDKTGTITTGELSVSDKLYVEVGEYDCIIASLLAATKDKNVTAKALQAEFVSDNIIPHVLALPFYAGRKYSAAELEGVGSYCLGAPEYVAASNPVIDKFVEDNALKGRRVIVLSRCSGNISQFEFSEVKPLLAIALEDTVREDAGETLKWFAANGVKILVISGDHPRTASEIAVKAGVDGADKFINCQGLDEHELCAALDNYTVFGRVSPEQKSDIVHILQKKGRTVGMVGDGVNDVQALKEADCSISFGSANEVARNVSRIVLVDSKFSQLPGVVAEGRRVVGNIERVASLYIMKNIFTIALTAIFLCMGKLFPFSTSQMLMIEAFVLGLPNLCLALQPNSKPLNGQFIPNVLRNAFPAALALIIAVMGVYFGLCPIFDIDGAMRTTVSAYTMVFSGFSALILLCIPFNMFRLKTVLAAIILFFGAVFLLRYTGRAGIGYVSFEVLDVSRKEILIITIGTAIAFAVNIFSRFLLKESYNNPPPDGDDYSEIEDMDNAEYVDTDNIYDMKST